MMRVIMKKTFGKCWFVKDLYLVTCALDGTDMEKIASVLKGAKIGQGVPFLHTPLSDLRNIFGKLWEKFEEHGSKMVKTKLLPIMEELLHRGGIGDVQYAVLMQELDKL